MLFATLALGVLLGACSEAPEPQRPGADMVFVNGRVYTVDTDRSWAEAVAVNDGKIVYVGTSAGAQEFAGTESTVVDLDGRMMMPAFQDSHVHPISGGIEASACDLNNLAGLPEYRSTIAEYAAANPDVEWILGGGWLMSVFGPGGSPSKTILDELVADQARVPDVRGRSFGLGQQPGAGDRRHHQGYTRSLGRHHRPGPRHRRARRQPPGRRHVAGARAHYPEETLADRQQGIRYSRDMFHRYRHHLDPGRFRQTCAVDWRPIARSSRLAN